MKFIRFTFVLLLIIALTFLLSNCTLPRIDSGEKEYMQVKNDITELMRSDSYKNSDNDNKVQLMGNLLERVQEKGKISNLHYNDYTFHYQNKFFGSCGVVVHDSDKNDWGNSTTNILSPKDFVNSITESRLLFAFGENEDSPIYQDLEDFVEKNSDKNITLKTNVNINLFKKFDLFDEVCLFVHGFYDEEGNRPIIWTNEDVALKISKEYRKLGKKGAIGAYTNSSAETKFVILPMFFEECYEKDDLKDSIVFFGVCEAFGKNDKINTAFFDSLKKVGVSSTIGFCNSVNQGYSYFLLKETIINYYNGLSIKDSLESAKEIWGFDENDYFKSHTEFETRNHPAFSVFQGNEEIVYKSTKITDYSEKELRAKLQNSINAPILHFFYDDYDGDGYHEAFVIVGTADSENEGMYSKADLWFVNKNGATKIKEEIYGYPNGVLKDEKYSFLSLEKSALGSGSVSYVFSVKNGKPIEMNVSEQYGDFSIDENNIYKGYTNDFSKGFHDYICTEFVFDSKSFKFEIKNDNDNKIDNSNKLTNAKGAMTDYLNLSFGDLTSVFGNDYSVIKSGGWIPDEDGEDRIVYYSNNITPLSFLFDDIGSSIPEGNIKVSAIKIGSCKEYDIMVHSDVNVKECYRDMSQKCGNKGKAQEGFLDGTMLYIYEAKDFTVEYEFDADIINDNAIADAITVYTRDYWKKIFG